MKTAYAIGRIKKLHQRDLNGATQHNFRTRPVLNANPSGTIIPLLNALDSKTFLQTVNDRFEKWKNKKLNTHTGKRGAKMSSDPVVCVEVMLSASPEYFRPKSPEKAGYWELDRLRAWEAKLKSFVQAEFGDNLISLVLHLDEATPHAHVLVMPFDENGNLNAKKVFNRQGLIKLQDNYAEACKSLGLQRGLRGSKAEHEKVKRFYTLVNQPTPQVVAINIEDALLEMPDKFDRLSDEKLKSFAVATFKAGARSASKSLKNNITAIQAKANAYDIVKRKEEAISSSLDAIQKVASEVRVIPLNEVLMYLGAIEVDDVWRMPERTITVKGSKFYDTIAKKGGSGAIDLVMHCEGITYREAVAWLSLQYGKDQTIGEAVRATREMVAEPANHPAPLPIPKPAPEKLLAIIHYLTVVRRIPAEMIKALVETGKLYADRFANCVFALTNDAGESSFEVTGTGDIPFSTIRGAKGYFALPPVIGGSKQAIFVKNSIDALSYRALNPSCGWVYAAAGNALDELRVLCRLIKRKGLDIVLAFDRGERSREVLNAMASVIDIRKIDAPVSGDWNDQLPGEELGKNIGGLTRSSRSIRGMRYKPY